MRARLARHHDNVDGAFYGWNLAWLSPAFKDWNIDEYLPRIRCPIFVIQGADDEYGTMKQVEAIERQATLEAAGGFIGRIAGRTAAQ